MSGNRNGRSASRGLVQIALIGLGVSLMVASCFALKSMMASGALEPTFTESMAGAAAHSTAIGYHAVLAVVLPLGAVFSFVAFAIMRYSTKGITARRSVG